MLIQSEIIFKVDVRQPGFLDLNKEPMTAGGMTGHGAGRERPAFTPDSQLQLWKNSLLQAQGLTSDSALPFLMLHREVKGDQKKSFTLLLSLHAANALPRLGSILFLKASGKKLLTYHILHRAFPAPANPEAIQSPRQGSFSHIMTSPHGWDLVSVLSLSLEEVRTNQHNFNYFQT